MVGGDLFNISALVLVLVLFVGDGDAKRHTWGNNHQWAKRRHPGNPGKRTTPPVEDTNTWRARFQVQLSEAKQGSFVIQVHPSWAPLGAARFRELVDAKFFDDCRFFRVVPNFMVQFGISGIPGERKNWNEIKDDPVLKGNERGIISFATSGKDSRTTQMFINFKNNGFLDSQGFSGFGEVVEGMDVVDAINAEYREQPDQGKIHAGGNAYLEDRFPRLSYIRTVEIE